MRISEKIDIDENIVSQVIANLKEDKWINDAQYALCYHQCQSTFRRQGSYVLTQKTAQKGISKSTIEENLKEFDFSGSCST